MVAEDSAQNQLRPEAVESLWHMWRLTGHAQYREWGWAIFLAFQKYSRGSAGFHTVQANPQPRLPWLAAPAQISSWRLVRLLCS